MVFPHDLLASQTWRHVGLGLSTSIFASGAVAILAPGPGAESLGIVPNTQEGRVLTNKCMIYLGVRDMATSAALFWFHAQGKQQEMGVVVGTWALMATAEAWTAAKGPKGWDATIWAFWWAIGLLALGSAGLMQS